MDRQVVGETPLGELLMEPGVEHVIIGKIVKVRGVHGQVLVRSLSDVPDRYRELAGALVLERDGSAAYFEIQSVEALAPDYVVKFRGIDDPESARERLVGRSLAVERAAVPPAGAAENYHFELLGLHVVAEDGRPIGVLESILETGANDIYVVRGPGGEVLIPATREVVADVDVAGGRMTVRVIPGLLGRDEEDEETKDGHGGGGRVGGAGPCGGGWQ